jgi:uncharacterized protein (TIGR03083 family)
MTVKYLDVIREESQRIVAAYVAAPEGRVPWSDRWSVGTVARHVAGTHHVVAGIVAGRPTADFGLFATLDAPEKGDPSFVAWFAGGTAALCEQLQTTPATDACWTWYDGAAGRVSFWGRRMAHESVVHRWDAQMGASGAADPIDPEVAADGIDEFLEIFVATVRSQSNTPPGPTVRLETLDTDDAWTVELPAGGRIVRRDNGDAAGRLLGRAADLLLLLWGRFPAIPDSITTEGPVSDRATLAQLLPAM